MLILFANNARDREQATGYQIDSTSELDACGLLIIVRFSGAIGRIVYSFKSQKTLLVALLAHR